MLVLGHAGTLIRRGLVLGPNTHSSRARILIGIEVEMDGYSGTLSCHGRNVAESIDSNDMNIYLGKAR